MSKWAMCRLCKYSTEIKMQMRTKPELRIKYELGFQLRCLRYSYNP